MINIKSRQNRNESQIGERVRSSTAKGCAVMEALHTRLILTHTDYKQRLQISRAIFATDRKEGMNKATVVTILRTQDTLRCYEDRGGICMYEPAFRGSVVL